MSSDFYTYSMGATQVIIGPSLTAEIKAPSHFHRWLFKKFAGGSLAIVSGISNVASQGYMMGDNEVISVYGPAKFYLAASGATVTVHIAHGHTAGWTNAI